MFNELIAIKQTKHLYNKNMLDLYYFISYQIFYTLFSDSSVHFLITIHLVR